MKQHITLAALLLVSGFLASCSYSARRTLFLPGAAPDTLAMQRVDIDEYRARYPKEDGVFLQSSHTLEHSLSQSTWTAWEANRLRFLVLNPDAEWLTTITIDAGPGSTVEDAYINVVSPDGTVRSFGLTDMKEEKSSDGSKTFRFAYPDVQVGTMVEEGYTIRHLPAEGADVPTEFALQHGVPCEHLTLKLSYPSEFKLRIKDIGPGRRPNVSERFDRRTGRVFEYEARNIPPLKDEPYSPFRKEMAEYLEIAITDVGSYSPMGTWGEYASIFKEYAIDRGEIETVKGGDILDGVVKEGMTDAEKIDAVITWVHENIEIGAGDLDDDFNDLIRKKEGNIFLITGLTRALLQKAGIESQFLLVHSGREGYFDENFITGGQLDFPAVMASVGDATYVLAPYLDHYPYDHIPEHLQGQRAMRIDAEGAHTFITLPAESVADNLLEEDYDLTIDDEGELRVVETKTFRGTEAWAIRQALEDIGEEEKMEWLQGLLTYEEGDVSLEKHEIIGATDYRKPLVIKLEYAIDNLVTVTPEEVIFQTGGLFSPSSNQSYKIDSEERTNPIRIYNDERFVKKVTIRHPESWRLTTELNEISFSNGFGDVHATSSAERGRLSVEQRRTLLRADEPPKKIHDLLAVMGERSRLNIPTLIFEIGEDGR